MKLHLVEDRPPVNITSPGSVPIDLEIGKMRITRDETGIFKIQPPDEIENVTPKNGLDLIEPINVSSSQKKERDRELLALQLVMQQLKIDNDQLKRQLKTNEKSTETIK